MSKIVQITDFIGKYAITQNNFSSASLQLFIDKYETIYTRQLLGLTLGDLFLIDIATPYTAPINPLYATLFNPIAVEISGYDVISTGVKDMLIGFIYFEFVRSLNIKVTPTGIVVGSNEVSREGKFGETDIFNIYNESVNSYNSIQYYINTNSINYPNYNGRNKRYAY